MRLLVTRPDDDAERTARALEKLGHEAVISPALRIRYRVDAPITTRRPQAILLTSVNAVRALDRHQHARTLKQSPVLAVGDRTAFEAKRAGFARALSASGRVDDLHDLVVQHCTPSDGTLLYAVGADQAGDLAGQLGETGFSVETVVVYRAEPEPALTAEAVTGLHEGAIDGILFYSVRSAAQFGAQLGKSGLESVQPPLICYCLSDAVADAVRDFTAGPVRVAATPDQLALFAALPAEK